MRRPLLLVSGLAPLLLAACQDGREPPPAPPARPAAPVSPVVPDFRPVVLSGEQTPALLGAGPADVVAFAFGDGAFAPIPVQVDERFVYDLAVAYRGLGPADCPGRGWCGDLGGHVVGPGYADPGTHVGPDPETALDADDEIALMRADFGERGRGHPTGVDAASGVEVVAEAGGRPRYAYLYRRTDPALDPAAGEAHVRYTTAFERGPYLTTYDRAGRTLPRRRESGGRASNPERSAVETAFYTLGFSDRWILDRLHLAPSTAGGGEARSDDLLDVDMIQFKPGACGRTPYTGSLSEGGFLVNRSGPVRAIRHVVGFNSGPLVTLRWTFYARYAESEVALRVHEVPGAMSFLDLSPAASGLTYRNAANPDGVPVDGRPDRLREGPVTWEALGGALPASGGDVSLVVRHEVATEGFREPLAVEGFYLDSASPEITACMGDDAYYGAHGAYVSTSLPNTDPRKGPAAVLALRRQFVFGGALETVVAELEEEAAVAVHSWRGGEPGAGS